MLQLTIPIPAPILPSTITFRTQVSAYHLDDYRPGYFWDKAADGRPMLETHFVYEDGGSLAIGCLNRVFPDTPWRIAIRSAIDAKTCDTDFAAAVLKLRAWFQQDQQEKRDWLKSFSQNSLRHNTK